MSPLTNSNHNGPMENYITLFEMLPDLTLFRIYQDVLGDSIPESKKDKIEQLRNFIDDNGQYDVKPLEESIFKHIDIHFAREPVYHGFDLERGSEGIPKAYDQSSKLQETLNEIYGPKKWGITLTVNGFQHFTTYTLGSAHVEKFDPIHGWRRISYCIPTPKNNRDTVEIFRNFGFGLTKPKYRKAVPTVNEVFDSLLLDAGCIYEFMTAEEFCSEFGYTEGFKNVMRGIKAFEACTKIRSFLDRALKKTS